MESTVGLKHSWGMPFLASPYSFFNLSPVFYAAMTCIQTGGAVAMDADELRKRLDGMTPVTDSLGRLRVEIMQATGRRNKVVWVPLDEAARLLTAHGSRAAIITIDSPAEGTGPNGETP